jgi:hypothetical protein
MSFAVHTLHIPPSHTARWPRSEPSGKRFDTRFAVTKMPPMPSSPSVRWKISVSSIVPRCTESRSTITEVPDRSKKKLDTPPIDVPVRNQRPLGSQPARLPAIAEPKSAAVANGVAPAAAMWHSGTTSLVASLVSMGGWASGAAWSLPHAASARTGRRRIGVSFPGSSRGSKPAGMTPAQPLRRPHCKV